MSHHVYTTRGIVLSQRAAREADRVSAVLTRDLGLVSALGRGMRKPGSKLSQALLPLSMVKISLVLGRRQWRVTTVTLLRDLSTEIREKRSARAALYRVAELLKKLVRGEDKHPALYDEFEAAAMILLDFEGEVIDWELFVVSRLLYRLGYLAEAEAPESPEEAHAKRKSLLTKVNESLRLSGLS